MLDTNPNLRQNPGYWSTPDRGKVGAMWRDGGSRRRHPHHHQARLIPSTPRRTASLRALLALMLGVGAPCRVTAQHPIVERVHRATLDNGLQVIVADNPAVPLATVLVAVHNGAFTQDSTEEGLAHLYEHVLFRSFRGDPSAFASEASKLNGRYNGTTSNEVVTYYLMLPAKNVVPGIKLLASLLRHARFSNGDLKEERPVVLDELQRHESDPEEQLSRQVGKMLWGSSWHRKDVSGDSSSIRGITLDRLKETYARYYVPNNAALIVTGDVAPDQVFDAARRHFGEWQPGPDPFADRPIPQVARRAASTAVMLGKDVPDVTIELAFQGPSVEADPAATYAADVLFDVLNDPGSAFQRRLVDAGPFQSVGGHYLTLRHTGPIEIRGKTTAARAREALLALIDELDNLDQLEGVSEEDLAIAKKRRLVETALTFERTAVLAPQLAFWWSAAGMDYYLTYQQRMGAQTMEDLRGFVRKYIVGKPRVIGVLASPAAVDQLAAWMRPSVRQSAP